MPRSASFVSRLQASVASFPVRTFLVTSTVLSAAVAAYLLVRRLRSQEKVSQPPTLSPASAPDSFSSSGGDSSKAHVNTCSSSGSSSTPPPPAGNGKQAEGLDQDGEEELAPASIFVYFGSQTGTAESYSEELASAILEEIDGVQKVPVIDLEDFEAEKFLKQKFKILVLATYGEGEPTDNAREFFSWLKEYAQSCERDGVEALSSSPRMRGFAAVFGLGNRDYERYNRMGKRTHKLLQKIHKAQREALVSNEGDSLLSAQVKGGGPASVFQLLCPLGLADGAGDPGADFAQWQREHLFPGLQRVFLGGGFGEVDKTGEVSSFASLASDTSLVSSPPVSPLPSQALPDGKPTAGLAENAKAEDPNKSASGLSDGHHNGVPTLAEGASQDLSGSALDQLLLGTSRSGSGARAVFEEDAAVEKAQKRVAMWVRRRTDESFRLAAASSVGVLLAEHRRLEGRMSFSTPGPDSSIVSLSSRTGRESTGGMGAAADVIKGSCSPALRKKFWDSCRLRQAPQGVSAKFFFSMQEAPVRRVEQLRQKPSVSSASSSSSPRSAPSPSSGSSGLRGGGRESKRASTEESTVEVELDLTELPSIQYHAADTMYCLHKNGDEEIRWWHEFLGFKDQGISLADYLHWLPGPEVLATSASSYTVPFPTPCTVEEALGYYCNLTGQLPKFALSCLSLWITDPEERRQWLFLVSEHHQACSLFDSCIKGPQLSLRDLLPVLAPSFKRPVAWSLHPGNEGCSSMQEGDGREDNLTERELGLVLSLLALAHSPRAYTIASSPLQISKEMGVRTVCLCVGLVAEHRDSLEASILRLQESGLKCRWGCVSSQQPRTVLQQEQRLFLGACSSYLTRQLKTGDNLKILVKPSSFRLPTNVRTPVIMIAAGTGIAPFIAFLRELESRGGWGSTVVLFFGCRREKEDFLYRDQLLRLAGHNGTSEHGKGKDDQLRSGNGAPILSHLFCAFSRQPGKPKAYVQDKVREEKELIWKLIREEKGNLYICGRTAMAAGVTEELARIAGDKLGGGEQGTAFIHELRHSHRIVEEVWA